MNLGSTFRKLVAPVAALVAAAACGATASAPDGPTPPPKPGEAVATAPPREPDPPATGAPGPEAPPPTASYGASHVLTESKLGDRLREIGLDPQALPTMDRLTAEQKKKVMPLLQRSLGYSECTGCHQSGDFKVRTKRVQIARKMWDHFVVDLKHSGGQPLFCDSCHGGHAEVLDRSDKDKLKAFMSDEYTDKLARKAGGEHTCKTCHGDKLELDIVGKLWNIR